MLYGKLRNRLFVKQALCSVFIAFVIGIGLSVAQIYYDMIAERQRIEALGRYRLEPALESLARAAFRLDETVATDVVNGLLNEEAITHIVVWDDFGDVLAEVSQAPERTVVQVFGFLFGREPLVTARSLFLHDQGLQVGAVALAIDPLVASRDFSYRTMNTLVAGVVKGLLLAIALMCYFYGTATRRIKRLSRNFCPASSMLLVGRDGDEIDTLASTIAAWAGENAALASELQDAARRVKLATSVASVGIWELDVEVDELRWDETMHAIYETTPETFHGVYADWRTRVHPEDLRDSEARFLGAVKTGEVFDYQFRIVTLDGKIKHIEAKAQIVTVREGLRRAVGVNFDITERVMREQQLIHAHEDADRARAQMSYDATHDALTSLHNRRAFNTYLQDLSVKAAATDEVGVCHIDLHRFKSINDAYGHTVGDFVLKQVGEMLAALSNDSAFVARIGGDEFAVVLTGENVLPRAKALAEAIGECCAQPLEYGKLNLHFGASVGIASGTAAQLQNLQENADIALYAAKRSNGDGFAVFDAAMREAAERHKRIADGLRVALKEDEFAVHFQPKLHAGRRNLAGFEALVRWEHPTLGLLPPADFLPIAEEVGLEQQIDRRVLQLSFAAARRLRALGLPVPQIALNVSLRRLRDPALLAQLESLWPFPCELVFEILETVDFDAVHSDLRVVLDGLRKLGVKIEIDDFGTGHASITSLLRLQPDGIKLDRSLVAGVQGMTVPSEDLLRALVDIGRASQIVITAEGVETEHQAQMLERLGCDILQGFYFGEPMTEGDLADWLMTAGSTSVLRIPAG